MKRPVTISRVEALGRLKAMTIVLCQEVERALRQEATMEAGNDFVKGQPDKRPYFGADAYNTIQAALANDLVLTLSRLFDVGRRTAKKNKRDMASIPVLIDLLKQRRCQRELVRRARDEWTPQIPSMAASQAKACQDAIQKGLDSYRRFRATGSGRRAMVTLKELRDNRLAHQLYRKEPKGLPRFNDLFALVDLAVRVVEPAKLAILGINHDFPDLALEFRRQADAFWKPALRAATEYEQ